MATKRGGVDENTLGLRQGWFDRMLGLFPPGSLIDLVRVTGCSPSPRQTPGGG